MGTTGESAGGLQFEAVPADRVDALLKELATRVRVVNEDALQHLVDRGVLARMAADGCCKPDGGTCCPNKRTAFEIPVSSTDIDRSSDVGPAR
jgi:hypothetical protein